MTDPILTEIAKEQKAQGKSIAKIEGHLAAQNGRLGKLEAFKDKIFWALLVFAVIIILGDKIAVAQHYQQNGVQVIEKCDYATDLLASRDLFLDSTAAIRDSETQEPIYFGSVSGFLQTFYQEESV